MAEKKEKKKEKKQEEAPAEAVEPVRATAKYVRISPRKLRLVADIVRGRKIDDARAQLAFTPKGGSKVVDKLIASAVANAENNHDLSGDELYIQKIFVNEGPTLKRYRPRAMGRAGRIRKRSSHITVELAPRKEG